MKSGSQFGENDLRLGVIGTDSPGTKASYPVFEWGNYWHVVKHASPKRVPLYTIFCMAELADLMHGSTFREPVVDILWNCANGNCPNQDQTARIPAAFHRQFGGE